MDDKPRLRECKAEQERLAAEAESRAEELWSSSSSKLREAERASKEAIYKGEVLERRVEGRGLRPRRPRSS